jgi:hypothetical protein
VMGELSVASVPPHDMRIAVCWSGVSFKRSLTSVILILGRRNVLIVGIRHVE